MPKSGGILMYDFTLVNTTIMLGIIYKKTIFKSILKNRRNLRFDIKEEVA